MKLEQRITAAVDRLTEAQCRQLLYEISLSLSTDCGRAERGMKTEPGYERHSCVDQVEEIEGIMDRAKLPIE